MFLPLSLNSMILKLYLDPMCSSGFSQYPRPTWHACAGLLEHFQGLRAFHLERFAQRDHVRDRGDLQLQLVSDVHCQVPLLVEEFRRLRHPFALTAQFNEDAVSADLDDTARDRISEPEVLFRRGRVGLE